MSNSIPPNKSSSSQNVNDNRGPEKNKRDKGKKFELKGKEEKGSQKEDANLFALMAETQQKGEQLAQQSKMEGVQASQKVADVQAASQIRAIIMKTVETMAVGKVGATDIAHLDLKAGEVPGAFAGASLNIAKTGNELTVNFTHFATPAMEAQAINLVEHNKEQLAQLVQALQVKGIQITELNVGNRSIALPKVEPLPSPMKISSSELGTQADRQRQREEKQDKDQSGPKK